MWDYELPRAHLIPSELPFGDYWVSSLRSSRKQPTSYLYEIDPAYYDAYDREFIIGDKKEETLEDENMEADVQVVD